MEELIKELLLGKQEEGEVTFVISYEIKNKFGVTDSYRSGYRVSEGVSPVNALGLVSQTENLIKLGL